MSVPVFEIPNLRLSGFTDGSDHARGPRPVLAPLQQRHSIVVVDDDPTMREVISGILRAENFAVTVLGDATEAMAGSDGSMDLLITDFDMPSVNGSQLAAALRARHPELRVLYQTAYPDMLFDRRPEIEPGSAFIEKPFTARGLREAVRLLLFGALNPPELC